MALSETSAVDYIRRKVWCPESEQYLRGTLHALSSIRTGTHMSAREQLAGERALFALIEREVSAFSASGVRVERLPASATAIEGQPDEAGCSGLLIRLSDNLPTPISVILQTGVHACGEWFPPGGNEQRIAGRGVAGSHAQVAMMLAQIRLIAEGVVDGAIERPDLAWLFTGVAADSPQGWEDPLPDERFAGSSVIMLAPTNGQICLNRPAVMRWTCEMNMSGHEDRGAVELLPFVVHGFEAVTRELFDETRDSVYPERTVGLDIGRLGAFGIDPGVACDHVVLDVVVLANANPERVIMRLVELIDDIISDYTETHADLTGQIDDFGQNKLKRHFNVAIEPARDEWQHYRIDVCGRSGRIDVEGQGDNAILKAASIIERLIQIGPNFPNVRAFIGLADGRGDSRVASMEGLLRFTNMHSAEEVQGRLAEAAERAVATYGRLRNVEPVLGMVRLTFEACHQTPLAEPAPGMIEPWRLAHEILDIPWHGTDEWAWPGYPPCIWRSGRAVVIFGPGDPARIGTPDESIEIESLQGGLAVSIVAMLAMQEK